MFETTTQINIYKFQVGIYLSPFLALLITQYYRLFVPASISLMVWCRRILSWLNLCIYLVTSTLDSTQFVGKNVFVWNVLVCFSETFLKFILKCWIYSRLDFNLETLLITNQPTTSITKSIPQSYQNIKNAQTFGQFHHYFCWMSLDGKTNAQRPDSADSAWHLCKELQGSSPTMSPKGTWEFSPKVGSTNGSPENHGFLFAESPTAKRKMIFRWRMLSFRKLTAPGKLMLGRRSFPFGMPSFQVPTIPTISFSRDQEGINTGVEESGWFFWSKYQRSVVDKKLINFPPHIHHSRLWTCRW